ncbi:hypothetical protein DFH06DRAFT_1150362 [Mycena polygramma]|nr:hypothetical protein DFH06DRAFT_1150362 [Mycena polygramma]
MQEQEAALRQANMPAEIVHQAAEQEKKHLSEAEQGALADLDAMIGAEDLPLEYPATAHYQLCHRTDNKPTAKRFRVSYAPARNRTWVPSETIIVQGPEEGAHLAPRDRCKKSREKGKGSGKFPEHESNVQPRKDKEITRTRYQPLREVDYNQYSKRSDHAPKRRRAHAQPTTRNNKGRGRAAKYRTNQEKQGADFDENIRFATWNGLRPPHKNQERAQERRNKDRMHENALQRRLRTQGASAGGHTLGHLRTQAGTYYSSAHEKPARTQLRRSETRIIRFPLRAHALRTRSTRRKHDERTSKRPFERQDEEAAELPMLGAYTAKEGHPAAQILIQQGRQPESAPPAHLNQVAEALRAPERRLLHPFHKKTRFRASTAAEFLQERSQRRAPRRRDPRRRDPPSRDLPGGTTLRGRATSGRRLEKINIAASRARDHATHNKKYATRATFDASGRTYTVITTGPITSIPQISSGPRKTREIWYI